MIETLDIPRQETYVVFPGKIIEQMPLLIKQGRILTTIYEYAKQRLLILDLHRAVDKSPESYQEGFRKRVNEVYERLWYDPINTGDLWLRQSAKQGGKGKVVLYNEQVLDFLKKNLKPELMVDGVLALKGELEGAYDSFTGESVIELSKDSITEFFGKRCTIEQAKQSPFWATVLKDLRDPYIDTNFEIFRQHPSVSRGDEDERGMSIHVDEPWDIATLQLWYFSGVDRGSFADGKKCLDDVDSRLVGKGLSDEGNKSDTLEAKILRELRMGKAVVDGNRVYATVVADNFNINP